MVKKSQTTICRLPFEMGVLKLNVDGAIFWGRNKAGVGCILHYEKGQALMASMKVEEQRSDPLEIELLAIFRELQLRVSFDIHSLVIESDSLLAIQVINDGENSCIQYGHLIREIQSLKHQMLHCSFQYVSRLCNFVAHQLTRHAWQVEHMCV